MEPVSKLTESQSHERPASDTQAERRQQYKPPKLSYWGPLREITKGDGGTLQDPPNTGGSFELE